ncbi:hypothetical protein SM003_004238 [Cronobacter malonaticus]|nr:hypothetical protein [Cronobacter malonaticus]
MKEFKGTPGPWTGKDVGICRQDRAGLQLGFIMTHDENRVAECAANARLIAAAPDLLEALQDFVDLFPDVIDGDAIMPALDKAYAAIAKAIGEEE